MRPIGINQFAPAAQDPLWAGVIFATHADGPSGKGNNVFIDGGPNAVDLVVTGRAPQGAFSPYVSDGGSATFLGVEAVAMNVANPAVALGPGQFCIEAWVYRASAAAPMVIATTGTAAGQWTLGVAANGAVEFYQGPTLWAGGGAGNVPLNTWTHVVMQRRGTDQFVIMVNGAVMAAGGGQTANLTGNLVTIAGVGPGAYVRWIGSICDFRIVVGSSVYGDLTPQPTSPLTAIAGTQLLLNFANAALLDAARKTNGMTVNVNTNAGQTKFGAGAIFSQDGTVGDGAYWPNVNSLFALGTGDFTFECWVYPLDNTGTRMLWDMRPANGGYPTLQLIDGVLSYVTGGSTRILGASAIALNAWTHIALCRVGTSTKAFVNGVQVGATYADATNYLSGPTMGLGGPTTGPALSLKGYMDDVRLTKGAGRYTANFTPPTQAFPNTGPPGTLTTLNPLDKHANIILSAGNLRASGSNDAYVNVRATNGRSAGKLYFEATNMIISGEGGGIGLMNAAASLVGGPGSAGKGFAYYNFGPINSNGVQIATGAQWRYDLGAKAAIAVDLGARMWWARQPAGTWVAGDPAAGTGGWALPADIATGVVFPTVCVYGVNDSYTLNFGASPFGFAIPAGFSPWG